MRPASPASLARRSSTGLWALAMSRILSNCSSISKSLPSTSTIKSASQSGYPAPAKASVARMQGRSMNSIATGKTPARIMSDTQAPATSLLSKPINTGSAPSGLCRIRNVASVTMPSWPSEPQMTPNKSNPSASKWLPPMSRISPCIVTNFTPIKLFEVTPYFKQCAPPEFIAMLPAIAQANWLDGSGA